MSSCSASLSSRASSSRSSRRSRAPARSPISSPGYVDAPLAEKLALLDELDPKVRAREVLRIVSRHLETLKMRERINAHVKEELGKTQREHVLRQQMKAIEDELGDGDDDAEASSTGSRSASPRRSSRRRPRRSPRSN